MKYIKSYEKIKQKNIKVGSIYTIQKHTYVGAIISKNKLIPLVKIISINGALLNVKTYFEETKEEYNYNCFKVNFTNIATQNEKDYFNSIENSKKYNL